ncbi:MAG: hypothetical protein N3A69_00065 [Leptospiraceae bacterium]|nr:hypothetical protein [Leptospiraceae bacterium]
MEFEKTAKQSRFLGSISVIFLTVSIFIFYSFRGEAGNENSYINLANLKSFVELGELRTYQEPLSFLLMFFFHKVFQMSYMGAYQLTLAFVLSYFLHLVLLSVREKTWKLNHYFLIYLLAFLPFTSYLPYYYLEEFLCFAFLLSLQNGFKLEKMRDLFRLIIYTVLAFLSSVPTFLFGYLFFVAWNTTQRMREKKTTVFFKKKNIPLRVFLIYFGVFCFVLFLFWFFDFYGKGTIKFLFKSFWDFFSSLFPIFIGIFVGEYLLRSEKELNALGTTAIVGIVILVSGYYTFRSSYENITVFENYHSEILNLKKNGVLQNKRQIVAKGAIADYLYYKINEQSLVEYGKASEIDLVLLPKLTTDALRLFNFQYYVLDKNTVLASKQDIEKLLKDNKSNPSLKGVYQTVQQYSQPLLPYEKMNRILCALFGLV